MSRLAVFLLLGCFVISASPAHAIRVAACTQEAKMCPDGSSVGRTGPHCEFAPCPDENAGEKDGSMDRVACTKDAKVCPDGSSVGRMPPQCKFAPCPGEDSSGPENPAEDPHYTEGNPAPETGPNPDDAVVVPLPAPMDGAPDTAPGVPPAPPDGDLDE